MSAPYEEGAQAFRDGIPLSSNPYPSLTDEVAVKRLSWLNGWRRAEWEDAQGPL